MATQPHFRDAIWDDYETAEPHRETHSLRPFVRIGIAALVVALAILAISKL
ncbi:hypothetical protein LRS73_10410 [Methylobacterium currus]|jgi:hypothetical protein|uniref:hypothetical protein n=1 Tax=Methylobacterium currus TaxID=2051553 RepID=UPI0013DFDFF1|nr:hypothetical protein [Methylobacterium currus]UHC18212.1 hypothetical protein LRS73_10410 [Methylobacterium currus]